MVMLLLSRPPIEGMEVYMIYVVVAIVIFIVIRKITEPKVTHLDKQALEELLKDKKKYQFVDVRTSDEFNSHKIKGFKNMPLQSLRSNVEKLSKDQPVVLMCASGSRSMNAARILKKAGFENLMNVKGGISRMT